MSDSVETKRWRITASDGVEVSFYPVFVTRDVKEGFTDGGSEKEVECTMIHMSMKNIHTGVVMEMDVAYQELFMFMYFCGNEEIRRQLQLRQEKKISHVPYEVTFKLTPEEVDAKMAKRLIRLPVDELTMAIARSDAQLMAGKATLGTLEEWFRKKAGKGRNVTK